MPTLSIIVPTRNRHSAVARLLARIASDAADSPVHEVIAVDDGSTDGTAGKLTEPLWPFPLQILRQNGSGAAVARNAGARIASGDVLLFLDDDVEPETGLIATHKSAHDLSDGLVAIGDLPPRIEDRGFFGVMLRSWWDGMQSSIRMPGHRYSYRDLLSGHFSVQRSAFVRLGGFDERLRCREDYELGYRALAAGLRMQFLPRAVAAHHDSSDVRKALRRKLDEGVADVQLVRWHPEMASTLPLSRLAYHSRLQRSMIALAWRSEPMGTTVADALTAGLRLLEGVRFRRRWRGILGALLAYWYWRGVATVLHTPAALDVLLNASRTASPPALTIDLAHGLEAAEAYLDSARPHRARLVYGVHPVGEVPDAPGSEPLRGAHLRPLLAKTLRREYLQALSEAGRVPPQLGPAAGALLMARRDRRSRRAAA